MGFTEETTTSGFHLMFILLVVFGAFVLVAAVLLVIRNVTKARKSGIDPFTMQTELAAKLLHSDALAAPQTKAPRLAELDAMLAADVISAQEHADARAAILRD